MYPTLYNASVRQPSRDTFTGNSIHRVSINPRLLIPERIDGRGHIEIDHDGLHFGVVMERFQAVLAAYAAYLVTAIGQHPMRSAECVNRHETRLDLCRDAMRARDVGGP